MIQQLMGFDPNQMFKMGQVPHDGVTSSELESLRGDHGSIPSLRRRAGPGDALML
jgi:hypothetical protein